jgi:tetratricopeptide (TPR) repeat protein
MSMTNMQHDAHGLVLTTTSADAASAFDAAVADYLDYQSSAFGQLKTALAADPDFVMALVFRACFFQMMETTSVRPKVQGWLDDMQPLLDGVTEREQAHVRAVQAWVNGDIIGATATWERILAEHPRDIIALKLHHYLTFWTGRTQALRAVTSAVLPAWDDSVPGYASVLGMHAFALEETGNHIGAEAIGREAVERNPNDLWAIHSVAHVLETQGRSAEGVTWLDYPTDAWDDRNPFRGHIWWHAALFNAAQGNYDKVLSLYDNEITSVNTPQNVDVQNLASLLARLELRSVDIGDRWAALAEHGKARIGDHAIVFNDIHWSLAMAAGGCADAASRHAQAMADFASTNSVWAAHVFAAVGTDLCRGLAAWGNQDYAAAADLMWPIKDDLAPIGGSHAQRDLFPQVLGDALLKAGRFAQARSLYSERVTLRPSARTDWERLSEALGGLGDGVGSRTAANRALAAAEPGA